MVTQEKEKYFLYNNPEREKEFDAMTQERSSPEDSIVEELNKKHAVIFIDQFYILTERENPIFGGTDFSLESKQSFKNRYENKVVETSAGLMKSKADIWLKSPHRREFKGIVFDPTMPQNVNGYYNLWRGFAKTEKIGNCSKYWEHVRSNICSRNEEFYLYVRKWISMIFQHPDEIHTSLVLIGSQGVGKNCFVEALGILLGIHYVLLSNISELVSNFNYHLKNAVLIHANEALWGGNQRDIGILKAMITERTCLIEGKNKDKIMVKNFKHLILSSNEDWPVHLDADDRRFFVLRVSDDHKEDQVYFSAIHEELKNGGYEALLYDLLNEDLKEFNPRRFPHSKDAFDIKIRSASPTDKYIYHALKNGSFDVGQSSSLGLWEETISKEIVFKDHRAWCAKNGLKHSQDDPFSKRLRKIIISTGDTRPTENGTRVNKYTFPPLKIARAEFEKFYKTTSDVWFDS